jgi:uncharacterized protein YciI
VGKKIQTHGGGTKMNKKFVYFYFMKNDPDKIRQIVSSHIKFWKEANLKEYIGGPFADRTGGMISFVAENLEEATTIIMKDPFVEEDILINKWIKEWIVE